MPKKILLFLFIGLFSFSIVVSAHLSGVLGDFLVGLDDKNSDAALLQAIDKTKSDITAISPHADALEKKFLANQDDAVNKLKSLSTQGIDSYLGLIGGAETLTDILVNEKIVERDIRQYMDDLDNLYFQYAQVNQTKMVLTGYQDMLQMVQANLAQKEVFLNKNAAPMLSKEYERSWIRTKLEFAWLVMDPLIETHLENDAKYVINFKKDISKNTYSISENSLNENSQLRYYVRSDHIYVHFKNEEDDLILIGTLHKSNNQHIDLVFEAAFLNGFNIPSENVSRITSFSIDYSKLFPSSSDFYVEQTNGVIYIQPIERTGE
jgi:hypothetical protein